MNKKLKFFSKKFKLFRRKAKWLRRHPLMLPVVAFLILFFAGSIGLVALNSRSAGASDTHLVKLHVDSKTTPIPTRADTVGQFLKRAKISLNPHDVVEPSLDTPILEDNFQINIYRAHPVTIVDGSKTTVTSTAQQEPRQVVEKAGIKLYPEDDIEVAKPDKALKDGVLGQDLIIHRATPLTINLYGTLLQARTRTATVGEVLKEKNIQPGKKDVVTPKLTTPVTAQIAIIITREGTKIITKHETIPMPVKYINDNSLAAGATAIRQNGSAGKRVVTYQINLENGKEVSRKAIQKVTIQPAVTKIVVRGTKVLVSADKAQWMSAAGIAPSDYGYVDNIIKHESTWNPAARNWKGCIGLGQSCPVGGAPALASACPGWEADPVCQLRFFSGYVKSHGYGSWAGAWEFWSNHGWW